MDSDFCNGKHLPFSRLIINITYTEAKRKKKNENSGKQMKISKVILVHFDPLLLLQ